MTMSNMSIFKNSKNHNLNKFIIKKKIRVSMLGKSPFIIFISCNHKKNISYCKTIRYSRIRYRHLYSTYARRSTQNLKLFNNHTHTWCMYAECR